MRPKYRVLTFFVDFFSVLNRTDSKQPCLFDSGWPQNCGKGVSVHWAIQMTTTISTNAIKCLLKQNSIMLSKKLFFYLIINISYKKVHKEKPSVIETSTY